MNIVEYWWAVGIGVASGYLLRMTHEVWLLLWRMAKETRAWRRTQREQAEVTRILEGIEITTEDAYPSLMIAKSPLVKHHWHHEEDSVTGWERATFVHAPDVDLPTQRRTLRQWWADLWADATPRTPEQVALQAYEDAVLAAGELHQGRHRADGYTEREVACLNTHTAEYPSLRHLRTGWRNVPVPVPAEVLT